MGLDNTLISLFVGHAPGKADIEAAGAAVGSWAGEEGLAIADSMEATEKIVLLQIADEPWITPLRTEFEMDEGTAKSWAASLSRHGGKPVVGGITHDSDLIGLFLAVNGDEARSLDVSDLYFGGELSSEAEEDLSAWQAVVDGAAGVEKLQQLWAAREANPAETLASICAAIRLDAGGAAGFGAARWFLTADSLEMPPDKRPVPTRVLAEIGVSDG